MRQTVLAAVMTLAVAPQLLAQTEGAVRVTAARANVRAEPNEKAAVVSQVTSGTMLTLRAVEGDWFRVQLPADPRLGGVRVEAFISRKVAALVTSAPGTSAPGPPAPRTPRTPAPQLPALPP